MQTMFPIEDFFLSKAIVLKAPKVFKNEKWSNLGQYDQRSEMKPKWLALFHWKIGFKFQHSTIDKTLE